MVMTPPIVLVVLSDLGIATLFLVKTGQLRPLISAILKSRKTLVRPALPDAVNRADGSFMTPALYPAPRSQGGRGLPIGAESLPPKRRKEAAHSGSQRGKQPQGYPSPTPDAKAAHRAKNPRKSGGSAPLFQRVEVGTFTSSCRCSNRPVQERSEI